MENSTLFRFTWITANYNGEIKIFGQDIRKGKVLHEIGYIPAKINDQTFPATVQEVVSLGLMKIM